MNSEQHIMQHLKCAEELMGFGAPKRKKKRYTVPLSTSAATCTSTRATGAHKGKYYLHYTKEEVLVRMFQLHRNLPHYNEFLPALLVLVLGSNTDDVAFDDILVEFRAADMMFCFHLACVFYFVVNFKSSLNEKKKELLRRSNYVLTALNLQWFVNFCEGEQENLKVRHHHGQSSSWFGDITFFYRWRNRVEYEDIEPNPAWHHDGLGNTRTVVFSACDPQPKTKKGCGTRVCYDIPKGFTYPEHPSDRRPNFTENEKKYLESKCTSLPPEQLITIDISRSSNSLHRGLQSDELKNISRVFFAFEESQEKIFDQVFLKMEDARRRHQGGLYISTVPHTIHTQLGYLVTDILHYLQKVTQKEEQDWEKEWGKTEGNILMTPEKLWQIPFDTIIKPHTYPHNSIYAIYGRRTDKEGKDDPWMESKYHLRVQETLQSVSQSNNARVLCKYTLQRRPEGSRAMDVLLEMHITHDLPLSWGNRWVISFSEYTDVRTFIADTVGEIKACHCLIPFEDKIYLRPI